MNVNRIKLKKIPARFTSGLHAGGGLFYVVWVVSIREKNTRQVCT